MLPAILGISALLVVVLLYAGCGYFAWTVPGVIALAAWALRGAAPLAAFVPLCAVFVALAVLFGVPALRRRVVTRSIMRLLARALPRLSETERVALEAGTVWWDGELFSGRPDWRKLLEFEIRPLSASERAFLDGPVEEFCAMIQDWEMIHDGDLPPEAWDLIKRERFFGLVIPPEYGGLGFSAHANSAVVMKVASRSVAAAVTVMVPNSLGPAELLLCYGTDEQKKYYLPRLASAEEIPCFALTGPEAGSDAAATRSEGVVCRGRFEGKEVLGMRLDWNKRYTTLGPVSTLIGLAFRLRDPDGLLGNRKDLGMTCALIPSSLPGIEIGARHDPMGIPFHNGPTRGRNVFVPLDCIIGGPEMAGHGWRMLMETLAGGRGVSLPALATAAAKLSTRVVSAYGMVRKQFNLPIGQFEGVEERIARIGGFTYLMDAARRLTVGAVDAGEKPAVVSAIVKAYLTEAMREVVNDAMDVQAGAGVSRGPRNVLALGYQAIPISITVEGANILTRCLIVFGQGAIRCHRYIQEQIRAIAEKDLTRFDRAFFGHVGLVSTNAIRTLALGLTGCRLARAPVPGPERALYRGLTRMSAAFALVSDFAMATLGGSLKRREKLSGRLADALAWMYIGSAVLKRFHDDGRPARDVPFLQWSCRHALWQVQQALAGVLDNLPNRPAAWLLRVLVFPLGARLRPPSDALGAAVARAMLTDTAVRDRLTAGIYLPPDTEPGLGQLDAAYVKVLETAEIEKKLRDARRAGRLERAPSDVLADRAVEAEIITAEERDRLREADVLREEVIQVDSFAGDSFHMPAQSPVEFFGSGPGAAAEDASGEPYVVRESPLPRVKTKSGAGEP